MNQKSYFLRTDAAHRSHSEKGRIKVVGLLPAALVILCLVAIAAGMGVRRGWFTSLNGSAVSAQASDQIESELITVRAFGFDPAEIKRPRGQFTLMIDNRSPFRDLALSLDRIVGNVPVEKIKDKPMPKGKARRLDNYNLPPGEYLLTEANHPEWKCLITITPQ